MKQRIRTPFFEIGTKNYVYGDKLLEYALAADVAAAKYDVDVLFIAPVVEIRRIAEKTENLILLAPYMDVIRPGRGLAEILPEGLKAAGAKGVVVNHCEKPMNLSAINATISRAMEIEFLVFACADSINEAKAIAELHPDIVNPEPSDWIGGEGGSICDLDFVKEAVCEVKSVDPTILVECAAGVRTSKQVYDMIIAGADGVGVSSGIMKALSPLKMIDEMIAATKQASIDRTIIKNCMF